jgi:hypothetical protein
MSGGRIFSPMRQHSSTSPTTFSVLSISAVMTAAMTVPLYIYIQRPAWKQIALVAGAALVVLAVAVGLFWGIYGNVLGRLFDPQSIALAKQLEALRPGIIPISRTTIRMYIWISSSGRVRILT